MLTPPSRAMASASCGSDRYAEDAPVDVPQRHLDGRARERIALHAPGHLAPHGSIRVASRPMSQGARYRPIVAAIDSADSSLHVGPTRQAASPHPTWPSRVSTSGLASDAVGAPRANRAESKSGRSIDGAPSVSHSATRRRVAGECWKPWPPNPTARNRPSLPGLSNTCSIFCPEGEPQRVFWAPRGSDNAVSPCPARRAEPRRRYSSRAVSTTRASCTSTESAPSMNEP
jgi:hypothetical protein